MKPLTFVTAAVVASTIMVTTASTQQFPPRPHIAEPRGGDGWGRGVPTPCSRLLGPGSCAPGPSIDVNRYIPWSRTTPSGGLRLQIRPASAAVYVDGRYAGRVDQFDGNSERLDLTPGTHSVVIRAPGYESLEIETVTRAGQTTVYRGTLSPSRDVPQP